MYYLIFSNFLVTFIVISSCSFVSNCTYGQQKVDTVIQKDFIIKQKDQENIKSGISIPKGDEIVASVKILKPKHAVLIIANKSLANVFIPYLPGRDSRYAFFYDYDLEKMDNSTGKWERVGERSDFGTGINALFPGAFFKQRIWVKEEGIYRINITYFVDEQLFNEMKKISELEPTERSKEYDRIGWKIDLARQSITTYPFSL